MCYYVRQGASGGASRGRWNKGFWRVIPYKTTYRDWNKRMQPLDKTTAYVNTGSCYVNQAEGLCGTVGDICYTGTTDVCLCSLTRERKRFRRLVMCLVVLFTIPFCFCLPSLLHQDMCGNFLSCPYVDLDMPLTLDKKNKKETGWRWVMCKSCSCSAKGSINLLKTPTLNWLTRRRITKWSQVSFVVAQSGGK